MSPEQQRANDLAWLERLEQTVIRDEASYRAAGNHEFADDSLEAAGVYRRILDALSAQQEPVAWRIEGEEVNEEWSGAFDYITDDAGVAEESEADGHKVTPLCPCVTRADPTPANAAPQTPNRSTGVPARD